MIGFPRLGAAGRLGNQLWQLASTIGIAWQQRTVPVFPPDWAYRPYFSVPDSYFGDTSRCQDAADFFQGPPEGRAYLQDYGLWRDVALDIHEILEPSGLAWTELNKRRDFWQLVMEREVVSLHVRRGDNAHDPETPDKAQYHPLRPMSYYREALELFPDTPVVVFSDDIAWCREQFGDLNPLFFEGTPRPKEHYPEYATAPVLDWIDLLAMTFCDHHILSNSSYAWWGAFLSEDPAPVYPVPWFGPKLAHIDASRMFPEHWRPIAHAH